jgi:hypothetical protein
MFEALKVILAVVLILSAPSFSYAEFAPNESVLMQKISASAPDAPLDDVLALLSQLPKNEAGDIGKKIAARSDYKILRTAATKLTKRIAAGEKLTVGDLRTVAFSTQRFACGEDACVYEIVLVYFLVAWFVGCLGSQMECLPSRGSYR